MGNEESWWRCEVVREARWDYGYTGDDPAFAGYSYRVEWHEYQVLRTTPKGVWLKCLDHWEDEAFVLGTATRQRAVPTRELALQDEIERRKRHVQGAEYRLDIAKSMLEKARSERSMEARRQCD